MTLSIATTVERRKRSTRPTTLGGALALACLAVAAAAEAITWPSPIYRERPVVFFRDVLGVDPWERQVEVIEAVRDHKRVAVSSGHKVSKSHSAAGLALWFYSSFEDARVVMSSTTSRQVDQILWRELRMMVARARVELPGEMHELARSGFKAKDFREIVGFTAKEAEAVAGISGKNLLYILDEASGIDQAIFEAIEGNRAGGARIVMFSNPTRTEGEFFEAFESKAAFYKTIRISSEETPNVKARREIIPGLATWEWIQEKREEWGEESALYKVRVKGEHAKNETGKIISLHLIGEAEARWSETEAAGPFHLGIDVAGEGEGGDETVFAPRRGQKVSPLLAFRGLTEDAIVANALGVVQRERSRRDPPATVVIDREGRIGYNVYTKLRAVAESDPRALQVIGVRASDKAVRQPHLYDRLRDELWANMVEFLRNGGAIPEDAKLEKELHAPTWVQHTVNGRNKVTPKPELKKALGRSPDRADAVCLACWEATAERPDNGGGRRGRDEEDDAPRNAFDPREGLRAFGR